MSASAIFACLACSFFALESYAASSTSSFALESHAASSTSSATPLFNPVLAEKSASASAVSPRQSYTIIVDKDGVMRRSDTGEEVSYYGTNYTLPFAHAYRMMPRMGADRKETIDLDVAHLRRLGFNGFRLHLWDVELSDSAGNLLSNDHLDLLDYMISRLEKEGIDIILTAQTNFGNGYPEKNIDTGAFTYDYPKCGIHEDPQSQKAQERYLKALVSHRNPYTGMTYGEDHAIIGIEINNEPCHTGSRKEVTRYIDRMAKALRSGGFDRIILYNVSHNGQVTEAYYDADIQGTTYQWYPDGLVAGHERKGNFLPYVDNYPIPWSESIKNYSKMARVVYEFDPGDVLCTYLYPAVARTFRKAGFQWVTQFAYDPTPIAAFNTEYQTHFLNLLYTPGKALGMSIAAEAMRRIPRGADYGTYPADTVFGPERNFRVSAIDDISLYDGDGIFIHTAPTDHSPADLTGLHRIAGVGSSPIVDYPGSGAYFIDRLSDSDTSSAIWRLEIMPDIAIYRDPFEKTSITRPLGSLYYASHDMKLTLPGLGKDFCALRIASGKRDAEPSAAVMTAEGGNITVTPGVYLLGADETTLRSVTAGMDMAALSEYCAPEKAILTANGLSPIPSVEHTPQAYISTSSPLELHAKVTATRRPASVTVYPSEISFWRDDNTLYEMTSEDGVNYTAVIPEEAVRDGFRYNIVVKDAEGEEYTYPARTPGNPLGWDVITSDYYISEAARPQDAFPLYLPHEGDSDLDVAMIPEAYTCRWNVASHAPYGAATLDLTATSENSGNVTVREYVGGRARSSALHLHDKDTVSVLTGTPLPEGTSVALVGADGLTFRAPLRLTSHDDSGYTYTAEVADMKLSPTQIIPAPYPTFLPREWVPAPGTKGTLDLDALDFVELTVPCGPSSEVNLSLRGILLE